MSISLFIDSSSTKSIYVTDPKWSDFYGDNPKDIWKKIPFKISFIDEGKEVDYELPQVIMSALRPILTRIDDRGNLVPRHVPLTSVEVEMEPSIGFGINGVYNFNETVRIWFSEHLSEVSLSISSQQVTQSYNCGVGSVGGELVASVLMLKEFEQNKSTHPHFLPK